MKITIKLNVPKWKAALAGIGEHFDQAITAAMNMAASMAKDAGDKDIRSAGRFGQRWTDALQVKVSGALNNMKLSMTLPIVGANLFETGGQIVGNPFLWIPFSGTDAEGIRARDYGPMFSGRTRTGKPLLFSMADKKPRYFATESVTIPKIFHLQEDLYSVRDNFRATFDTAWKSTG